MRITVKEKGYRGQWTYWVYWGDGGTGVLIYPKALSATAEIRVDGISYLYRPMATGYFELKGGNGVELFTKEVSRDAFSITTRKLEYSQFMLYNTGICHDEFRLADHKGYQAARVIRRLNWRKFKEYVSMPCRSDLSGTHLGRLLLMVCIKHSMI